MSIDFSNIFTIEQFAAVNHDRYEKLFMVALTYGDAIRNHNFNGFVTANYDPENSIGKNAKETVARKYPELCGVEQAIIISAITFPDSNKFISALFSKSGITVDLIRKMSRIIANRQTNPNYSSVSDNILTKNITVIAKIMKMYFGISDYSLVMNKLHCLIAQYPELFAEINKELAVKIPDPEKDITKIKDMIIRYGNLLF